MAFRAAGNWLIAGIVVLCTLSLPAIVQQASGQGFDPGLFSEMRWRCIDDTEPRRGAHGRALRGLE